MKCETCQADMTIFGCRVSGLPFHWCPNCGTLRTCEHDAPFVAPAVLSRISPSAYLPVGAHLPAADVGKAIGVACCEATFATAAQAEEHERLPIAEHERRRRHLPEQGMRYLQAQGRAVRPTEPEADRECIIEPHTYVLNDKGTNACKDCGLDIAHLIHNRGNHGQETD